MNHRHLLPEEIDLLLDDEEGFGVAPLRTHLEGCPECGARFADLSHVVGRLEAMPHLAPAPRLADRVMSQVHVFEPWHVTLRDLVSHWAPQSSFWRVVVGATGGVMAVALTFGAAWVGRRADALLFLASLGLERTRDGVASVAAETASLLFGAGAASAVQRGGTLAAVAATVGLLAAVGGVAFGVKAVATVGRRRRS